MPAAPAQKVAFPFMTRLYSDDLNGWRLARAALAPSNDDGIPLDSGRQPVDAPHRAGSRLVGGPWASPFAPLESCRKQASPTGRENPLRAWRNDRLSKSALLRLEIGLGVL